jgi:hypothetical protein
VVTPSSPRAKAPAPAQITCDACGKVGKAHGAEDVKSRACSSDCCKRLLDEKRSPVGWVKLPEAKKP